MDAACPQINVIAGDPGFRLLTALLYIRSSQPSQKRPQDRLALSEDDVGENVTGNFLSSSATSSTSGELSVQYDAPDLGLLPYHRDRIRAAAEALGWRGVDDLRSSQCTRKIKDVIDGHVQNLPPLPHKTVESRKIVLMLSKSGEITVKSNVINVEKTSDPDRILNHKWMPESMDDATGFDTFNCKVYVDLQPSRPSTLTSQKTSHRCVYTSARQRLGIALQEAPTSRDVLIYNPYGEITETSCSTVYFKRGGNWITPAAICGSMIGVTRRLALDKGLCKQGIVEIKDLRAGEEIWLSNGVRGFFRGTIMTDSLTLGARANSEEVNIAKLGAGLSPESRAGRALGWKATDDSEQ